MNGKHTIVPFFNFDGFGLWTTKTYCIYTRNPPHPTSPSLFPAAESSVHKTRFAISDEDISPWAIPATAITSGNIINLIQTDVYSNQNPFPRNGDVSDNPFADKENLRFADDTCAYEYARQPFCRTVRIARHVAIVLIVPRFYCISAEY